MVVTFDIETLGVNAYLYKICMHAANWYSCWRRLSMIADEDVGQPEAIVAVDVLYRKFMTMRKNAEGKNYHGT